MTVYILKLDTDILGCFKERKTAEQSRDTLPTGQKERATVTTHVAYSAPIDFNPKR